MRCKNCTKNIKKGVYCGVPCRNESYRNGNAPRQGATTGLETKKLMSIKAINNPKRFTWEGKKLSPEHVEKARLGRWGEGYQPTGSSDYNERRRFRREMQKLVFERDDYTCQRCGSRGVDLQVNHKKSWVDYPELRFDMNNCETTCAQCHYFVTFGRPMPESIRGWGHNLLKGGALL